MTWGEQTDVPESADWYNSSYIIAWGSTCRRRVRPTPTSLPKCATKAPKPSPSPGLLGSREAERPVAGAKQGTDSALAMAMGHVILKEFHLITRATISSTTAAATPTCRCWCCWTSRTMAAWYRGVCRASDLADGLGEANNPEWKTVAFDIAGNLVVPNGSIGSAGAKKANGTLSHWRQAMKPS
jgi:nitrate reductase alpha subunit